MHCTVAIAGRDESLLVWIIIIGFGIMASAFITRTKIVEGAHTSVEC